MSEQVSVLVPAAPVPAADPPPAPVSAPVVEPAPIDEGQVEEPIMPDTDVPVAQRHLFQKRTRAQRREDLVLIEEWMRLNYSQYKMRDLLNTMRSYKISRQQIGYDCAEVGRELKARQIKPTLIARAVQLSTLDNYRDIVMTAWEESRQTKEVTKVERTGTPGKGVSKDTNPTKVVVEKERSPGDPRWVNLLLQIEEQRAKLLGTYAAVKTTVAVEGEVEHKHTLATPAMRAAYARSLLLKTGLPPDVIESVPMKRLIENSPPENAEESKPQ